MTTTDTYELICSHCKYFREYFFKHGLVPCKNCVHNPVIDDNFERKENERISE